MIQDVSSIYQTPSIDWQDESVRQGLAKLVMRLFDHWGLDTRTQLGLLGLSEKSRSLLSQYRSGKKPLPATRDILDRAGWLLAIHKALRLLYPKDEIRRYQFVHQRNALLDNQKPIEIMHQHGLLGIARIARFLDHNRGQ